MRILISILLILVLCKPVLAEFNPYEKRVLPDGAIEYSATGEPSLETQEITCKDQRELPNENLQELGIKDLEVLRFLTEKFHERLHSFNRNKKANWKETDILFSKIMETVEKSEFYPNDDLLDFKTNSDLIYVVEQLAQVGWYHTKRYGRPAIELLERLVAKYPNNNLLEYRLEHAISWFIFQADNVALTNPKGLLTPDEQKEYAARLVGFYLQRPDWGWISIIGDEEKIKKLANIAPEETQQLIAIREARRSEN